MDRTDFLASIRAAWAFIDTRLKLGEAVINTNSLAVDPLFNKVALERTSTYDSIYRAALSQSHYNIILDDQALFQFSWSSVTNWRLAYLPNPWITGFEQGLKTKKEAEDMLHNGHLTLEQFDEVLSSLELSNAVPPMRYEFALEQHREVVHPAAHFHIGRHTENRWGVSRRLSPKAFCMLVMKQYYSAEWNALSCFAGHEGGECIDQEFIEVLSGCNVVPNIPAAEKRLLHFSST